MGPPSYMRSAVDQTSLCAVYLYIFRVMVLEWPVLHKCLYVPCCVLGRPTHFTKIINKSIDILNLLSYPLHKGHAVTHLVKPLRYKSEDRGFDSR